MESSLRFEWKGHTEAAVGMFFVQPWLTSKTANPKNDALKTTSPQTRSRHVSVGTRLKSGNR